MNWSQVNPRFGMGDMTGSLAGRIKSPTACLLGLNYQTLYHATHPVHTGVNHQLNVDWKYLLKPEVIT